MNTIMVTGGAGFIGANFFRMAFAKTDARLVVIDKLTYAGHRENLEGFWQDSRLQFIETDNDDECTDIYLPRDEIIIAWNHTQIGG